jgi:DNA ligase-1
MRRRKSMAIRFKPMLAGKAPEDLSSLDYPMLLSPKLDGIRAVVINGEVLSRSLKPIPNEHVQARFGRPELEGLDGELILGDPTDPLCFNRTTSAVMSRTAQEGEYVTFYVFDEIYSEDPYEERLLRVLEGCNAGVVPLDHVVVSSAQEVMAEYEDLLAEGYEGAMLRKPSGPYKCGRSTVKEQYLLKVKPHVDAEARVVGVIQEMHNGNEATINELGHTERSAHQANLTGTGRVGALEVEYNGMQFKIGVFKDVTAEQRKFWWDHMQSELIGKLCKFRYLQVGMKDAPRHPVFLGWRDERDMSE